MRLTEVTEMLADISRRAHEGAVKADAKALQRRPTRYRIVCRGCGDAGKGGAHCPAMADGEHRWTTEIFND